MRAEDDKITEKDLVVTRLSLTLDEEAISQFVDKAVDISVVAQRQVHVNRNVLKTKETSQLRYTGYQVVDVPVVLVVQVPQEQVVAKTVEIPRSLLGEKIVAIPEVRTIQGTRTSESFRISVIGVSIHSFVFEVSVSFHLLASLVVMRQCVPWMIKLCEWSPQSQSCDLKCQLSFFCEKVLFHFETSR